MNIPVNIGLTFDLSSEIFFVLSLIDQKLHFTFLQMGFLDILVMGNNMLQLIQSAKM